MTSVRRLGQELKMDLMVEPCRGYIFEVEQRVREQDTAREERSFRIVFSLFPIDEQAARTDRHEAEQ